MGDVRPLADSPPAAPAAVPTVVRAPARERWSWALYDFANTIWSMNVASLYFVTWLVADLGASNSATMWATSISSVLMAVAIPVLGAVSDARRRRKLWVVGFTLLSCAATAGIGLFGQSLLPLYGEAVVGGAVRPAGFHLAGVALVAVTLAYTVASFAYQAAQPFYNAMMPDLVPPDEYGTLSGFGTAVGYAGTIAGVMLVAPFFDGTIPLIGALPAGIVDTLRAIVPGTAHAGRVSTFVPTALLFALFSVPLVVFTRDHHPVRRPTRVAWREAFGEIARTVRDARRHPGSLRFILTSLVYQDAIGTVVAVLGIYAIKAVGFTQSAVNLIFTVLPVTAVLGSYVCGRVSDRIGPKRTLLGVLAGWVLLLLALIVFPTRTAFWIIGAAIGLIFGGQNVAERPMLLGLVPAEEAGRYFGLLLLSARAGALFGPLVWGYTIDWLEPAVGTGVAYRVGIGTIIAFFAASILVLRGVPDARSGATRRPPAV